jgi:alanine-synthesizing transaminase
VLSRRTRWDRRPNRLAALLERKRAEGARLIDLTETNPTRVGLTPPPELLAPLADPGNLRYEPEPLGMTEARAAVAADFTRRGARVSCDSIVLTASTSEAYAYLFKLLCDPGDVVLVPRPSYPLFDYLAALESVEVATYALAYDGEWRLDTRSLAAAVGPRTRAIVLVNPNNPTGSFLKRDEVDAVREAAERAGAAIISDEVFGDYAFGPDPRRVATLAGERDVLAFALGGLSKSCGLPQLKLGWMAVSGPRAEAAEAIARLEVVADTYLSVATPVQRAAADVLGRRAGLQAPIAARVGRNLASLEGRARGTAATLLQVEGGWSAVLRVPATMSEEERALELLESHEVVVHPGYFFDFEREAFLVVSLLPPPEAFEEGVDRIVRVL